MDRDQARAAVVERLHQRGVGGPEGIEIVDTKTIEKHYGWIFFYNSRRYLESRELVHALVGHGPVVVLADTGEIVELGSAFPAHEAIRQLEESLQLDKR